MGDLDEVSRVLGSLEAKIDHLQVVTTAQGKKLDRIDTTLTNTRLRVAGIAGTTGLITGAMAQGIMEYIKIKLGGSE